jgi:hypothetical protein
MSELRKMVGSGHDRGVSRHGVDTADPSSSGDVERTRRCGKSDWCCYTVAWSKLERVDSVCAAMQPVVLSWANTFLVFGVLVFCEQQHRN